MSLPSCPSDIRIVKRWLRTEVLWLHRPKHKAELCPRLMVAKIDIGMHLVGQFFDQGEPDSRAGRGPGQLATYPIETLKNFFAVLMLNTWPVIPHGKGHEWLRVVAHL